MSMQDASSSGLATASEEKTAVHHRAATQRERECVGDAHRHVDR